jgi:peptidoglycan/LPS O-acetylase OafA/YrhL
MKTKRTTLGGVFLAAAYLLVYVYPRHTGLWIRYRWAGVILGIVAAMFMFRERQEDRVVLLGLRYGIAFLVIGVTFLLSFALGGGSSDGFVGSMGLGIAEREFYVHYRTRNTSLPTP